LIGKAALAPPELARTPGRFGKPPIIRYMSFSRMEKLSRERLPSPYDKYFEQKRVEVFYTIERDVIITVTVYVFYGNWREKMQILYNVKTDLLYLRRDDRKQQVIDKRLSQDIVLDLGEDNRIVGIEILDASKHLNLERLLPVEYEQL
jgi:uncharacterized protein YuzE